MNQIRSSVDRREGGNALIEMLLFVPLFFLFIFAVIDTSMVFVDRAGIADGLRAGMNTAPVFAREHNIVQIGEDGRSVQLASAREIEQFLAGVSSEVRENTARVLGVPLDEYPNLFQVNTALIQVDIDPTDGSIEGRRIVAAPYTLGQLIEVDGVDFTPAEDFLDYHFDGGGTDVSSFALPLGLIQASASSNSASIRYLDTAFVLYSEVKALTRGIHHAYVRSVLGNLYSIQEQELLPLRTQIL